MTHRTPTRPLLASAAPLAPALAAALLALVALPAHAQLDTALSEARASTAAAAAAQQQVDAAADRADSASREYSATLQQADNLRLFVDRQDIFLESQRSELDSIRRQLATVESIKQGVVPMMLEMVVRLEDSINADLPFRLEERLARVDDVKDTLANPEVSPAEQYRRVLNAYEIETNYGYQVEAYSGPHPSLPGNEVTFMRAGRTSWLFTTADGDIQVYDMGAGDWREATGADMSQIRQAIRVANEQAAPSIIYAPIVKQ